MPLAFTVLVVLATVAVLVMVDWLAVVVVVIVVLDARIQLQAPETSDGLALDASPHDEAVGAALFFFDANETISPQMVSV